MWEGPWRAPLCSGAIDDQGVLRRQREQGALRRRKACGVKDPLTHLLDAPIAPIVPTVILRQDHVIEGCPQLRAGHPQQDLRVRLRRIPLEDLMRATTKPTPARRGRPRKRPPAGEEA